MIAPNLPLQNDPEPQLAPVKEVIHKLYSEILAHTEAILHKAIRIGGELVPAQKDLEQQKRYENWVDITLPFSARTARDYVTVYRNRELIENEGGGDRLSIRAALKLIRDAAKAVEPIALEVCPLEMDVPAEEVQEEEVRLADRGIVLIEAETGFVAEIISLLRAAKRAGKDVKFQRLSALDGDVPLDPPFNEWLRRPIREAQPVRANKLPALKKSSSI